MKSFCFLNFQALTVVDPRISLVPHVSIWHNRFMRSLLQALALLVFCCATCFAQTYQPGFRTIGVWEEDPPTRLDINIWYPTTRQPKELNYPPWVIAGALNAKPAEGRFPLLLLSHASPADRFAYYKLAARLAQEGFVVVSFTHRRDHMDNMDDMFTWPQLSDRIKEIEKAISVALADKELQGCIDGARMGLIGFGSGATVALLMGGALPTCSAWPDYCARAGALDPYCSPWARERMNTLCGKFPLTQSLADPSIKAIAAIAPGFGMIFDAGSFEHFHPPLLLVAAGNDSFNRAWLHCQPIARQVGDKARFLNLPEADAGALISPCPQALAEELPELCLSLDQAQKDKIQARLVETLLAFFRNYLVIEGNLPVISQPPDLSPAKVEPAAPATDKNKKRK